MVKSYLVGGAVRDSLLGIQSKDLDYTVEASSYQEMKEWIQSKGKIFLEQPQYLTIRAHISGKQPADYVLARKDGAYSDARRPDSVEPGTLLDDLARRDFTVNAMALDEETGTIIDPYDGQKDLRNLDLRCVGAAYDRFQEDALRMLRALRFSITKGFFLHIDIIKALQSTKLIELLEKNVSLDRKRDELYKCFAFDTLETISTMEMYPGISRVLFNTKGRTGKIWLEPTSKEP